MRKLRHVTHGQQFDREGLERLFSAADDMKVIVRTGKNTMLDGKIMATLFYEASTRTRLSFESAMYRLGGNILGTENAKEFSSAAKGETLEDTIRIVGEYVDIIVLRHTMEGAAKRAAGVSSVPIINAGDGEGQHPTQALLDLYTIQDELGRIDGTHIALVGDLRRGRTARSLAYLLGKYDDITITLVAPEPLRMKKDIITYLKKHDVEVQENKFVEVVEEVDCVYVTRIQRERMPIEEYEEVKQSYKLTPELVNRMNDSAIILHPLPRREEIPVSIDSNPRAKYFEQAKNGLYVRMALIDELLQ